MAGYQSKSVRTPGGHCAAALAARGLHVAVAERELVGGKCSAQMASLPE